MKQKWTQRLARIGAHTIICGFYHITQPSTIGGPEWLNELGRWI